MDIKKVDLNLLRVFDAIAATSSVTLAGEALGLSQPSISFALKKLRQLTDDMLFVRTTQGMEPTPRAVRMIAPIRQVLEMVELDIFQSEEFSPIETERVFRLSLSDLGEMILLPQLLKRLAVESPYARINTVTMPPHRLEEAMESGQVDLAIGYFPDIKKAGFYQRLLLKHSFCCLARIDYPNIGTKFTIEQFEEASHLVVHAQGRSQEVFEGFLTTKGINRPVALRIPHFTSVPYLVMESDLVVTLPRVVAESFARYHPLRTIDLPFQSPTFDLKQHWHAKYHREPSNQWLREIVHDTFRDYPVY